MSGNEETSLYCLTNLLVLTAEYEVVLLALYSNVRLQIPCFAYSLPELLEQALRIDNPNCGLQQSPLASQHSPLVLRHLLLAIQSLTHSY